MEEADQFDAAFAEFSKQPEAPPQAEAQAAPEPVAATAPPAQPAPAEPEPKSESAPPSVDELQRQVKEALHRERSSANRISAFAQENNKLQSMIAEMRQRLDALDAAKAAPAAAPATDEADVLANAPDLEAAVQKRVRAVTAGLESTVTELRKRLDQTEQVATQAKAGLDPIVAREERQQHEAVWNALDTRFSPAWREDIKTPDFDGWLKEQPRQIVEIFETAKTAQDSASVLTLYYAAKGKPITAAAPSAPAANPNTERLRMAAGVAPRGNQRPPSGPAPDDFDGNFALFSQALKRA